MSCDIKPGLCQRMGLVYNMVCKDCKMEGKTTIYIGETSRCAFDRSQEHVRAMRRSDKESPLVEHRDLEHPGKEPNFEMQISCFPKSSRHGVQPGVENNGSQGCNHRVL